MTNNTLPVHALAEVVAATGTEHPVSGDNIARAKADGETQPALLDLLDWDAV